MNQSLLQGSAKGYARKRNSYDLAKSSNSLRNGKKSLPEVCIDLNQPHRRPKLTIPDPVRAHIDPIRPHPDVSHFHPDPKRPSHKPKTKKQHAIIKPIYHTEIVRKAQQDETKNILSEYRDEIEVLKLDNERLREENDRLRGREKFLNRRMGEMQSERELEREEEGEVQRQLEMKVERYANKIKQLYEELIKEKRQNRKTGETDRREQAEPAVFTSINSENRNRAKGELISYRHQPSRYEILESEVDKYKRLTSPSSHSRGKEKSVAKWYEQQKQNLRRYEQRGEDAYYRIDRIRMAPPDSDRD